MSVLKEVDVSVCPNTAISHGEGNRCTNNITELVVLGFNRSSINLYVDYTGLFSFMDSHFIMLTVSIGSEARYFIYQGCALRLQIGIRIMLSSA